MPGKPQPEGTGRVSTSTRQQPVHHIKLAQSELELGDVTFLQGRLPDTLQVIEIDLIPPATPLGHLSKDYQRLLRERPRLWRDQRAEPQGLLEPRGRPGESGVPEPGSHTCRYGEERVEEDEESATRHQT